jgi:PEP-CTERM motif
MRRLLIYAFGAVTLLLMSATAFADPVTLTFEGLKDLEPINNFYNGGTGGFGSGPGPNFGIGFSSDSLALISRDAGGNGNFSGEPSTNTIAFFLSGAGDTMNVASGFDTGFSFFYSSNGAASVNVFSGLNGTGTLLATLSLTSNFNRDPCTGAGPFCTWDPIGVTFGGVAESVIFSGAANQAGFDNITLGSATPGGAVPEPSSLALLGTALFGVAGIARRKFKW